MTRRGTLKSAARLASGRDPLHQILVKPPLFHSLEGHKTLTYTKCEKILRLVVGNENCERNSLRVINPMELSRFCSILVIVAGVRMA